MLRIFILVTCSLFAGCMSNEIVGRADGGIYLDLIAIEHGHAKYPDPLRLGLMGDRPTTLSGAVDALGKIVPTVGKGGRATRVACSTKLKSSLSETYQDCKYAVCKLLPERSRIQDCGYFIRLEQWVQREWLGALCLVEGANENFSLTRWFRQRDISDCGAMSELVMVAYMQQLAGLGWDESQLLLQSSGWE